MPSADPVSLKQRVLRAASWSMLGYALSQALRLGSNLIMTRLLEPQLFGIMAIVLVVLHGLWLFSDIGIRQHVIQSARAEDPDFINTAWSAQILRGVLIWVLALAVGGAFHFAGRAGWITGGHVYADPDLPAAIAVTSFAAVIGGFESTRLAIFARRLSQRPLVSIELASQVMAIVVMVAWAILQPSVWALVAGGLTAALVRTALSHTILPGSLNRWHWNREAFAEILQFGKWIFLSSMLGFLLINGDRILLGGFISTELFGIYSIAFLLVSSIQNAMSRLADNVMLPTLSEVARERPGDLKATYYGFRMRLDPLVLSGAGFLIAAGELVIRLLYDSRYAAAGHMLQVLAFTLISWRYSLVDQAYLALGKPNLLAITIAIRAVALYVGVPLGFYLFGLEGALWGIVLSGFASAPASLYFAARYQLLDARRELIILPMLLPGAALGLALVALTRTGG